MRWGDARRSDNVEDRRGSGLGGAGRLGGGTILVVVVLSLLFGRNPLEVLGLLEQAGVGTDSVQPAGPAPAPPANDAGADFVRAILGETEDVWGGIFEKSGKQYVRPHLVLFSGRVRTDCGGASSATGPFYCPGDQKVYLDLSFFDEMRQHLGGGGDFAQAYVIAHEVGHHVQALTGLDAKLQQAREQGREMRGAAGLSVRMELQADCYAGVWANRSQARHQWLAAGDIESALATATAIGDDRLQRQAQGTVVPESFTHGTSEQRVRWFKAGFDSGLVKSCDTFSAMPL